MQLPYQPTVLSDAGIDREPLEEAWISLVRAADRHEFGGAVALLVHRGEIILYRATGWAVREPEELRSPMATDTVFDLASLTKVTATTPSILHLASQGAFSLDAPLGEVLPGFGLAGARRDVTIRRLMTHTGGLSAWRDVFMHGHGPDAYVTEFAATQPEHPVGGQVIYSDPSFILLGEVVRAASGRPASQYAHDEIFVPLGMTETMYLPPRSLRPRIAATELGNVHETKMAHGEHPVIGPWRDGLLRGEVHDGNAWYGLDGVSGHAGLFGTALDLARYGQFWLGDGLVGDTRLLPAALLREATTCQYEIPGETERRGLGWRLLPVGGPEEHDSGRGLSDLAFGHTGFTGTSLWMDPARELVVVLLTNRVHPRVRNEYLATRAAFHASIGQAVPLAAPVTPGMS